MVHAALVVAVELVVVEDIDVAVVVEGNEEDGELIVGLTGAR